MATRSYSKLSRNAEDVAEAAEFTGQKNCSVRRTRASWLKGMKQLRIACMQKWKTMSNRFRLNRWSKRSWTWRSEACRHEKESGAAMHLSQVGAAATAVIFRQFVAKGAEQAMQQPSALEGELSKRFEVPHQPAPDTPTHIPKGQSAAEGEEMSAARSTGSQRVVNLDCQRRVATKAARLLPVLILCCHQGLGHVRATGDEFIFTQKWR